MTQEQMTEKMVSELKLNEKQAKKVTKLNKKFKTLIEGEQQDNMKGQRPPMGQGRPDGNRGGGRPGGGVGGGMPGGGMGGPGGAGGFGGCELCDAKTNYVSARCGWSEGGFCQCAFRSPNRDDYSQW